MIRYLLFLLTLIVTINTKAQDKHLYKKYFVEAGEYFMDEDYERATQVYLKMISLGMGNPHIYFNLGYSYLMTPGEMQNAIMYLEKASFDITPDFKEGSVKEKKAPVDAVYYLAKAYRLSGKFDDAIKNYQIYKSYLNVKDTYMHDFITLQIETCNNARRMMSQPVEVSIQPLPESINTADNEYCPVITADGKTMFYTSVQMVYDKDYGEYLPFALIFTTTRDENGNWSKPKEMTQKLGCDGNFYTSSISADGKQLVFYVSEFGDGNLYITHNENKIWSPLKPLPRPINTKSNETHGCFTPDGKGFYFVSNRSGGFGGKDIWYCETNNNGKWSEPVNLGITINTQFDEETPFLSSDGNTLFFSSEGHSSMGGLDVYRCEKTGPGQWSAPINLGYPVNTLDDDWFYAPTYKTYRAIMPYLNYEKSGKSDLYEIIFPEPEEPQMAEEVVDSSIIERQAQSDTIAVVQTQTQEITPYQPPVEQPINQTVEQPVNQISQTNQPETTNIASTPEPPAAVQVKPVITEIKIIGTIELSDNNTADERFTVKIFEANRVKGNLVFDNISGKFSAMVKPGRYKLEAQGQGYYKTSTEVNIPAGYDRPELEVTLRLDPVAVASGEYYTIKSIFFDYCSSEIKRDGIVEIEKLYRVMDENPSLYVEITGHADSKGSEQGNIIISEKRAEAVVNYLIDKGIDPMRFIAKGVGDAVNLAINTNPDGTDNPEGRSYNRRADIKILKSNNDKIQIEPVWIPEKLRAVKPLYFTVQLMQSTKPLSPSYFQKYAKDSIPNVWLYQTADCYIYAAGQFKTKSKAVSVLNRAIEAGFNDAVIISSDDLQIMKTKALRIKKPVRKKVESPESTVYTIQLIALRNPVDISYFKNIDNVKVYKGNDGIYRYYTGELRGMQQAKLYKTEIASKGYGDAFIIALDRLKTK